MNQFKRFKKDPYKGIKYFFKKNCSINRYKKEILIQDNRKTKTLVDIIKKNQFLIIYGNKGIGKTTYIKQIIYEYFKTKKIFYFELPDLYKLLNKNIKFKIYFYKYIFQDFDIFIFDKFNYIDNFLQLKNDFYIFFKQFNKHNFKTLIIYDINHINELKSQIKQIIYLEKIKFFRFSDPNFDTKIKFIQNIQTEKNIALPEEKLIFIAHTCNTFNELNDFFSKKRSSIKDFHKKIFQKVSNILGVSSEELITSKRSKKVVLARQICMYILKHVHNYSTINISRIFKKNHSSVIYSIKKIQKLRQNRMDIAKILTIFEQKN